MEGLLIAFTGSTFQTSQIRRTLTNLRIGAKLEKGVIATVCDIAMPSIYSAKDSMFTKFRVRFGIRRCKQLRSI